MFDRCHVTQTASQDWSGSPADRRLEMNTKSLCTDILPSEHARTRRTAHGRGHKGVGKRSPAFLHDAASLVHRLHGA